MAKVCKKTGLHSIQPDSLKHHSDLEGDMYTVFDEQCLNSRHKVPLEMEGLQTEMQLDTGCAFTLATKSMYDKFCSRFT